MGWSYSFTPYIWLLIVSIVFLLLACYSWRHRSVPGALPFVFTCLFGSLWVAGSALELAAVDVQTKVFWMKFQLSTALRCWLTPGAWAWGQFPGRVIDPYNQYRKRAEP